MMYDFIEWLICYGSPIIASLKTLRFESDELQDCYDYSLFSLEKAIATGNKDIVCANIVDSLIELSKIINGGLTMDKTNRCHCGAEAKLAHYTTWDGLKVYDVRCTKCNTHVSIPPETAERAIAEWNGRRVYTQIRRWANDDFVKEG